MLSKSSRVTTQSAELVKMQPQVFCKESAFGRNWGKLVRLQSPPVSNKGLVAGASKLELNATILNALSDEGNDSNQAEAQASLAAAAACNPSADKTEATATNLAPGAVTVCMWHHLELMADRYNASVGIGPFSIDVQSNVDGTRSATMASSTHCLVLIPDADAVRMYVVPRELMSGAYSNGPQFEPTSMVLMTRRGGKVQWQTKSGVALTMSVMNAACHSLFQSLVQRTVSSYQ
jgi:hypothetical protein